jgi:hypothetical protein
LGVFIRIVSLCHNSYLLILAGKIPGSSIFSYKIYQNFLAMSRQNSVKIKRKSNFSETIVIHHKTSVPGEQKMHIFTI